MESKLPSSSDAASSVRNLSIRQLRGVKTRGSRLPPVNIRELTQVTGSKKVVAPNIPQRRKVIKKEIEIPERSTVGPVSTLDSDISGGRGRQQKVFLQTGGSFLAEGPAARIRRNPVKDEALSIYRAARKNTQASSETNVDPEVIKDLMASYEANEVYEDYLGTRPPCRLPLLKEKLGCKIKMELDDDDGIKKEIKEEFDEDTEPDIKKTETEVFAKKEDKVIHKVEMDIIPEKKPTSEEFQTVKDNGLLILLQLPQLSGTIDLETKEKNPKGKNLEDKNKELEKESEHKVKFVETLEEGCIGKLRIMKSGKMKILLGSMEFEFLDGSPSESYWEAVTIETRGNEGDITVLGKIEKKMILSPIIDKLITENSKANKS